MEGKKREVKVDERGRVVADPSRQQKIKEARSKRVVTAREGVFDAGDDAEAIMPDDATPEQIKEAKRLRRAIVAGLKTVVPTAASALVLHELSSFVKEEKRKKDADPSYKPKDINLCTMTVPNTNVFCSGNKDITRDKMPQFVTQIIPGSKAEQYARENPDKFFYDEMAQLDTLDASGAFEDALAAKGIKIERKTVPVVTLKATQNELDGSKVVAIADSLIKGRKAGATDAERKKAEKTLEHAVYVTKDGYVLDGHHRYAAIVATDLAEDGNPGDVNMAVSMIDATIDEILPFSIAWTENFGLATQSAKPSERKNDASTVQRTKVKKMFRRFVATSGRYTDV